MRVQKNKKRYKISISISALMLAGCGGGGGGGGQSPAVTPSNFTQVTAIPPVTPVPTDVALLNTQEFRRSSALEQINVFPAYEEGLSGRGVTVAIIDTGIDTDNPEFAGRISTNSRDLVISGIVASDEVRQGGPSLDDEQGHGTAVAGIIGAARNDVDIHGVAPEAELLILRASQGDTLTILGTALTQGSIDSVNNNVDVLNFSFGSNESIARSAFRNIFDRLADADIVTVVAAGNDDLPHPDESSRAASDPQAQGAAIIVGSVDRDNELSSFSNRAGDAADFFIVAPGLGIPTVAIDGGTRSFSGTSASAPFVTGAAALLRERWPNLTAPEVVDILLISATDLGAPGTDEIFGRGLLNIGAALQPIGTTNTKTVTGREVAIGTVTQTSLSAPFGTDVDRFTGFNPIIVFDDFNRDFAVDINSAAQIQNAAALDVENLVSPIVKSRFSNTQLARGLQITAQVTQDFAPQDPRLGFVSFSSDAQNPNNVSQNVRTSFALTQNLPNAGKVAFASGFSSSLTDDITGVGLKPNAQFLGRDIFDDAYTARFNSDVSSLVSLPSGKGRSFDVRFDSDRSENQVTLDPNLPIILQSGRFIPTSKVRTLRLGFTQNISQDIRSGKSIRFEVGYQEEGDTILGAYLPDTFGQNIDTNTIYGGASAALTHKNGWSLYGKAALGVSELKQNVASLVTGNTEITTSSFALGAEKKNVFAKNDLFGFSVSQPLRVEAGVLSLELPTSYDAQTNNLAFETQSLALRPSAREVDIETSYALDTKQGWRFEGNLVHQFNAGHSRGDATTLIVKASISY